MSKQGLDLAVLKKFHLWASLPPEALQRLVERMRFSSYEVGETIFPNEQSDNCLCVLWRGEARVYANSHDKNHAALLRTMQNGAIFGVHCVYNADIAPQSTIVAAKCCEVLLIPAPVWEETLASHAPTMANYIRFLTQRVEFLNQKIRYLTASSAEQRLALYLLSEIPTDDVAVALPLSAVALAELLDLGRASLYRAFDRLSADGFLSRHGRLYCLHRREDLLTHYQH